MNSKLLKPVVAVVLLCVLAGWVGTTSATATVSDQRVQTAATDETCVEVDNWYDKPSEYFLVGENNDVFVHANSTKDADPPNCNSESVDTMYIFSVPAGEYTLSIRRTATTATGGEMHARLG